MEEKFLPIGTVVLLKGGSKKVMITGFCSIDAEEPDVVYDYNGCIFPEGYLKSDQTCLFNHDQIAQIFFKGYEDEESKTFHEQLLNLEKELPTDTNAPKDEIETINVN